MNKQKLPSLNILGLWSERNGKENTECRIYRKIDKLRVILSKTKLEKYFSKTCLDCECVCKRESPHLWLVSPTHTQWISKLQRGYFLLLLNILQYQSSRFFLWFSRVIVCVSFKSFMVNNLHKRLYWHEQPACVCLCVCEYA